MELTKFDDEMLMHEIKADNELAFNELFARYERLLKIPAYRTLKDWELVADAINHVMLSIWQKRETLQIKNMAAYLHGAIKKRCANIIRDLIDYRKKVCNKDFFGIDINANTTCPAEVKDFYKHLEIAINRIPVLSSQEAYRMYIFDDKSQKDIAQIMKTTEGAVKQMIYRAAQIVRPFLERFRNSFSVL